MESPNLSALDDVCGPGETRSARSMRIASPEPRSGEPPGVVRMREVRGMPPPPPPGVLHLGQEGVPVAVARGPEPGVRWYRPQDHRNVGSQHDATSFSRQPQPHGDRAPSLLRISLAQLPRRKVVKVYSPRSRPQGGIAPLLAYSAHGLSEVAYDHFGRNTPVLRPDRPASASWLH